MEAPCPPTPGSANARRSQIRAGSRNLLCGTGIWFSSNNFKEPIWGLGWRPVSLESFMPVFLEEHQERIKNYLAAERE